MRKRTDNKNAINTFYEVDNALKQIALNDTFIDEQTALMNQQLISVKEQYEPDIQKRIDENSKLEKDIEKFLNKNKSLFEKIRTKVLTFGKVGFQRGIKHLGKSKDATWATITENFFTSFGAKHVKVKMTLLKDSVMVALDKGEISPEQIEATGATVVQKDRPFYKPFKDKVKNSK
jgi:phage host-nuclease inhibitor protein Gam